MPKPSVFEFDVFADWPINARLDENRLKSIRDDLDKHVASATTAVSMRDYPKGRMTLAFDDKVLQTGLLAFPPKISSLEHQPYDHVEPGRRTARLLHLHVERLLHDDRPDDAVQSIHAILNCGSSYRSDNCAISQLSWFFCRNTAARRLERSLGLGVVSKRELSNLTDHFQRELAEDIAIQAIRGQRALLQRIFERFESDHGFLVDFLRLGTDGVAREADIEMRFLARLVRANLPADHALAMRLLNESQAIASLDAAAQVPRWKRFAEQNKSRRDEENLFSRKNISFHVAIVLENIGKATLNDRARLLCCRTVIAAEMYRLEHRVWPKKLTDLCPAFLDAAPIDPFDGKPLKYAILADGVAIYSCGTDGKDDGGQVLVEKKNVPSADLGFRLWNPDRRNLPAPKPAKIEIDE